MLLQREWHLHEAEGWPAGGVPVDEARVDDGELIMLASVTIGDFVTTFVLGVVVGLALSASAFFYFNRKLVAKK